MNLFIDAVIILVYFAVIAYIGLRMGKRENSLHDFALGGRNIPWWAVMASIIAAETSAATFLGAPGEGYEKRSFAYVQLVIGVIIGRFVVGTVFLKPYYQYKVYTVYDYLGVRFGPRTRKFVSGLFLVMRTLAMGSRLFVPSLVMVLAWRLFMGGEVQFSQGAVTTVWPYFVAISALTIVTCIYTAKGGIKAVIWTDVVQACLMFGGALISIVTLLNLTGGLAAVTKAVPALAHLDGYFLTGLEPARISEWQADKHLVTMNAWEYVKLIFASDYTLFSAIIASSMMNMAAFGTDQDMVQRLLTATSYKKARRSLLTAAFMDIPIASAFTFIGILLFVYYQQSPTFMPAANSDVFGSFILNVMPVGIRGLVLAGVFATAMGSLSAALNSLATSAVNDWYIPHFGKNRSATDHVRAARWFTALFAFLMVLIAVGFAYAKVTDPKLRIIPVVLGIAGFILGPMLGVFLIGMFTRNRGSDRGNIIAICCGLTATVVLGKLNITILNGIGPLLGIKEPFAAPSWLPEVSFTWFAMIGAVVVFCVGIWFKTPQETLDQALRTAEGAEAEDSTPIALRQNDQPITEAPAG
ncbi:MAG: sodium:solute symporter [Chthonomonadales bacterium]